MGTLENIFARHALRKKKERNYLRKWSYKNGVIIIIIILCHQPGYPWPSLAILPYRSSLPASPQGYTPYPHRAFARPCEGVHRSTLLMSPSLLLQQCLACLVRLTLIVFMMGGRWPCSCCFVGCFYPKLFVLASSLLFYLFYTILFSHKLLFRLFLIIFIFSFIFKSFINFFNSVTHEVIETHNTQFCRQNTY